ncbi:hypothetical protein JRQ81_018002, partial [Phrynocephalus forsythii]
MHYDFGRITMITATADLQLQATHLQFENVRATTVSLLDPRRTWNETDPDPRAYHCNTLLFFHWQGSRALQMSRDLLGMKSGSCVIKDMPSLNEQRQREPYCHRMPCP